MSARFWRSRAFARKKIASDPLMIGLFLLY